MSVCLLCTLTLGSCGQQQNLIFAFSSSKIMCSSPQPSWWPPLDLLQYVNVGLAPGIPKLDTVFQTQSNCQAEGNNHFSYCWLNLANTALYVVRFHCCNSTLQCWYNIFLSISVNTFWKYQVRQNFRLSIYERKLFKISYTEIKAFL